MQCLRPAFALLIIALVYFYRADKPPLWGDEADTGIAARNILRCGYPIVYDGRNVSIFENGSQLNRNLVCKKVPWIQYYLGALSLFIFGNSTLGLRVLFAFGGLLSFFPIYAILKSRLKYPTILTVLTLIAPQVVLFQRNARYYPLIILLYAVLVWHLLREFKSSRNHFILASLIFVLFFHTHPFAAVCSSLSLIAFCLFFRRAVLAPYFFACGIGFASWFIWYRLLGPSLDESALPISLLKTNFSLWFKVFGIGFWATIVDMDAVDCVPILLWTAVLAVLLIRGRNALRELFREQLYAFVFVNILLQTVASAALFGFDDRNHYSLLRYAPHLLVFGLVCAFMVLNSVIASKSLYLFVSMFAVAFNFLTISFWANPLSRGIPASWLVPVYSEIFRPRQNAWDLVVSRFGAELKNASGQDTVVFFLPYWTQEVAIFYLGDRYLIRPMLPSAECVQSLRKTMGVQALNRLFDRPEWIVDFGDYFEGDLTRYDLVDVIPSYQTQPDNGSRPELTRHTFAQSVVEKNVKLFRLRKSW
jgi:hypothetical protein